VVTRNAEMAARMRVMRLHGINRDAFDRFTSKTPAWYYEIVAPGFKYNMTDMAGAMGRVQLRRLPAFLQRRQQLAARYLEGLHDLPLILPADAPAGDIHAWHLFVLRLRPERLGMERDRFIEELKARNIGTSVHYRPLHMMTFYARKYGYRPEQFPVALDAFQRMVSLPLNPRLTDQDVDDVVTAVREATAVRPPSLVPSGSVAAAS